MGGRKHLPAHQSYPYLNTVGGHLEHVHVLCRLEARAPRPLCKGIDQIRRNGLRGGGYYCRTRRLLQIVQRHTSKRCRRPSHGADGGSESDRLRAQGHQKRSRVDDVEEKKEEVEKEEEEESIPAPAGRPSSSPARLGEQRLWHERPKRRGCLTRTCCYK